MKKMPVAIVAILILGCTAGPALSNKPPGMSGPGCTGKGTSCMNAYKGGLAIDVTYVDAALEVRIQKADLDKESTVRMFSKRYYEQTNDLAFSPQFCLSIKAPKTCKLVKGNYYYSQDARQYTIFYGRPYR